MTGLLLVVCSMTLARRLQTHDHQSWCSNMEPGNRRLLPSGVENEHCYKNYLFFLFGSFQKRQILTCCTIFTYSQIRQNYTLSCKKYFYRLSGKNLTCTARFISVTFATLRSTKSDPMQLPPDTFPALKIKISQKCGFGRNPEGQLGLLRRSRSSKVTNFGTNQKLICDFLLVINSNLPRRPGLPVSDWAGTGVSGRRLSAYFRRQHAPTPIDRHSDVRRPTFQ